MIVRIKASKAYDVVIEEGSVETLASFLKTSFKGSKVMIVTDDTVDRLYGKEMEERLKDFAVEKYVLKSGELSKNTTELVQILEHLAACNFRRNDVMIAFGGGVVGDITGLCAGLYLRGISFVQIPTTFLSAIDSSVGGKTAVNLIHGKNLMGLFYQPEIVLIDRNFFQTLKDETFEDGMAEAIKYAMIRSEKLMETLEQHDIDKCSPLLDSIIEECVRIKQDVVEEDEFDLGIRQILNFGHTFGHALELVSKMEISHGRGVAMGMMIMTNVYAKDIAARLKKVLEKYNLLIPCEYPAKEVVKACFVDKKTQADTINIVYCRSVGVAELERVDLSALESIYLEGNR